MKPADASAPLVILGFGNMGRAIVRGALSAGVLESSSLLVIDPSEPARDHAHAMRLRAAPDPSAALEFIRAGGARRLLLAIKPQALPALAEVLPISTIAPGLEILSILAGTTIANLRSRFGESHAYVRVMPNLAASVGMGIAALASNPGTPPSALAGARRLFESVGDAIDVDESLMDAFTAVAGSGPAYVFLLAEAMARGAVGVGFDHETARRIVRRTIAGAAALMEHDPSPFEDLRAGVTSKGGTTAAALGVLEGAGFAASIERAIAAARDRGRELGRA